MIQTIIIADDSFTARMVAKRCLEIAGCADARFLEASNGMEALDLAKNNEVDLLITDLNMPKMDGQSLLRRIKSNPRTTDLPVLVISSLSNPAKDAELINMGAFAVLSKPISPVNVAKAMQNLTKESTWG